MQGRQEVDAHANAFHDCTEGSFGTFDVDRKSRRIVHLAEMLSAQCNEYKFSAHRLLRRLSRGLLARQRRRRCVTLAIPTSPTSRNRRAVGVGKFSANDVPDSDVFKVIWHLAERLRDRAVKASSETHPHDDIFYGKCFICAEIACVDRRRNPDVRLPHRATLIHLCRRLRG